MQWPNLEINRSQKDFRIQWWQPWKYIDPWIYRPALWFDEGRWLWCNWGVRLKIRLSHHTTQQTFLLTAKLDCRASQISSHQATEHRSTTKKGAAKQTAAAMERQHCTPTPRLQEFKAHHIDGAGLPSTVYRAEISTTSNAAHPEPPEARNKSTDRPHHSNVQATRTTTSWQHHRYQNLTTTSQWSQQPAMTAAGPTELTEQELGKLIEWQKKIHSIPSHVERGGQGRDRVADIYKFFREVDGAWYSGTWWHTVVAEKWIFVKQWAWDKYTDYVIPV